MHRKSQTDLQCQKILPWEEARFAFRHPMGINDWNISVISIIVNIITHLSSFTRLTILPS